MILLGVSMSYVCLSVVNADRISGAFAMEGSLSVLMVSFRFDVVILRLCSTSSFGRTYSLSAAWSESGVWRVKIVFIIFVKLYIVYPRSCCFSFMALARSSFPMMSESSPSGSFFQRLTALPAPVAF